MASAYGCLAKPPLSGKLLEHIVDFCNAAPRPKVTSDSFSPLAKAAARQGGHGHLLLPSLAPTICWVLPLCFPICGLGTVSQQPHLCFQLAADSPFW